MAQRLHHEYQTDGAVTAGMVRDAVSSLTEDDITNTSPITAGGSEVGIEVDGTALHVRVEGHEGDWSKTSEDALRRAVEGVDGVEELTTAEGGYEANGGED